MGRLMFAPVSRRRVMIARRIVVAAALVGAALPGGSSAEERFITLASTTSTEQSGLFRHLIPIFREDSGIDVRVVAVGTGQALAIGARGRRRRALRARPPRRGQVRRR